MKLKPFLLLLLIGLLCGIPNPGYSVRFKRINQTGDRIFVCDWFCGKVIVKKIEKNTYRVYSVNFKGEMKANSEMDAAIMACQERENPYTPFNRKGSTGTGACN